MSARVGVVWDDALSGYDLGPAHPLAPMRAQLAMRLAHELGVFAHDNVRLLGPVEPVARELLERVHTKEYVDAVVAASDDLSTIDLEHGLGTPDVPVFADMHRESARVVGATLLGAQSVHGGEFDHDASLSGGHHHAMPSTAEGFCVYNDIGVAVQWLLDVGYERIAYIDLDVHHGDGVQTMFWDDPRVVTISLHESPLTLFPGTGFPTEIGGPDAPGSAVNIALPAGTGDQGWLRAFTGIVPEILKAFGPQILVTQQGADAHLLDPLAHLTMSIDGQRISYELVHRWAHEFAGGKWLAVGGGGYACPEVVPRAWALLLAEACGHPVDASVMVPASYCAFVLEALHRPSPERMTDGHTPWPRPFALGLDPEDPVDKAILATRRAVYPAWGLVTEPMDWF